MLFGLWILPSLTVPQVLFWVPDIGITMDVGSDLDSQLTEIRDLDSIDLLSGIDD